MNTIRVLNGLDPDQDPQFLFGFKLFAQLISKQQKSLLAREVLIMQKHVQKTHGFQKSGKKKNIIFLVRKTGITSYV